MLLKKIKRVLFPDLKTLRLSVDFIEPFIPLINQHPFIQSLTIHIFSEEGEWWSGDEDDSEYDSDEDNASGEEEDWNADENKVRSSNDSDKDSASSEEEYMNADEGNVQSLNNDAVELLGPFPHLKYYHGPCRLALDIIPGSSLEYISITLKPYDDFVSALILLAKISTTLRRISIQISAWNEVAFPVLAEYAPQLVEVEYKSNGYPEDYDEEADVNSFFGNFTK